MVRITPIYKPWEGHLQGVPQPYLGNLSTIVFHNLLTGMILQVRFPLRNCTYADFNNADARFCKLVGLLVFSVKIGGFTPWRSRIHFWGCYVCVCVCGCVWKSRVWSRSIYFPHLPILCIFGTRVIWYILTYWQLGAWFQIYRELEDQGLSSEFTPKICENYYLPKEALLNSTHCCWPHLYIHFPWTPKPWNVKVLNPIYGL